jgi:hypothetical protein
MSEPKSLSLDSHGAPDGPVAAVETPFDAEGRALGGARRSNEIPSRPPALLEAAEHFGLSMEELTLAALQARTAKFASRHVLNTAIGRSTTEPRPRWETRQGDDFALTPEQFVTKHYAAEKAAVTPRPVWDRNGPYGHRPADFVAMAYGPEMAAGTLHRKMIAQEQRELWIKLKGWLKSRPMPDGIDIPTYPEWNTRQLATLHVSHAMREVVRLAAVTSVREKKLRARQTGPAFQPHSSSPSHSY